MLIRKYGLALAVALVVFGGLTSTATTTAHAGEAETVIHVGAYANPPLIIIEGEDVSGLAPEVLEEVALRNNWRIEYVIASWPEQLEMLKSGDIDLLMAIAWTQERSRIYDFGNSALLMNWGVIATSSSGDTVVNQIADLKGLRIAALQDDVYLDEAEGLSGALQRAGVDTAITEYPSYLDAIDAVGSGGADAVVANRLVLAEQAPSHGLQMTPIVINPVSIRYAAPKDAPESRSLLSTIDTTLSELKLDPESAYFRALTAHVPGLLPASEGLPDWVVIAAVASALLLAIMVAAVLVLRSAVSRQTRELSVVVKRLRALFDAIPDAVFVLSPHGVILDIKEAGEWQPSLPREDQIGKHVLELPFSETVRHEIIEQLDSVANDGLARTATYSLNTPYPDGEPRHFEARFSKASPAELLMIVRDTTEQVFSERAERARAEELEIAVAARTEELVQMNLELAAASQAKSVFLANMSHELRTPLNSIIGFSGTMLSGLTGELNEEQLRQLEMVSSSGRHLLSLVDDVLDLARVESGRTDPLPEDVDVVETVREATRTLESRTAEKAIALKVDAHEVGTLYTDRRMLLQILLNLLNNAVKFTTEGGVTARVRRGTPDSVVIEIEDTGPGIPADELARTFESFYQVPRQDVAKSEGFGLGLPISARLARMLGGDLSVDSEVGRGSTFRLVISDYASPEPPDSATRPTSEHEHPAEQPAVADDTQEST